MNPTTVRRLTQEHRLLHTQPLPPNYLFPPPTSTTSSSDLTTLHLLLLGPSGTPYSSGVFTLQLKFPTTYPTTPPTARFVTKIFHPNVDDSTGAICVDTLKRDWRAELHVRDILVVISCLLIEPNPESALNANAARLFTEDYKAFEDRVRTLTEVHARCHVELKGVVEEARKRGDDNGNGNGGGKTVGRKEVRRVVEEGGLPEGRFGEDTNRRRETTTTTDNQEVEVEVTEDEEDDAKENDPRISPTYYTHLSDDNVAMPSPTPTVATGAISTSSISTTPTERERIPRMGHGRALPVRIIPASRPPLTSPRKNILGKRPLETLPTPVIDDDGYEEVPLGVGNNVRWPSSSSSSSSLSTTSSSGLVIREGDDGREEKKKRNKTGHGHGHGRVGSVTQHHHHPSSPSSSRAATKDVDSGFDLGRGIGIGIGIDMTGGYNIDNFDTVTSKHDLSTTSFINTNAGGTFSTPVSVSTHINGISHGSIPPASTPAGGAMTEHHNPMTSQIQDPTSFIANATFNNNNNQSIDAMEITSGNNNTNTNGMVKTTDEGKENHLGGLGLGMGVGIGSQDAKDDDTDLGERGTVGKTMLTPALSCLGVVTPTAAGLGIGDTAMVVEVGGIAASMDRSNEMGSTATTTESTGGAAGAGTGAMKKMKPKPKPRLGLRRL
ncbi:MAG: hypothetical protein M1823_000254 [Watsoniomyces obsoletus]|nr:MAG: hypothetical protein M1823_000254 [Watsoniomyces obsoletus]